MHTFESNKSKFTKSEETWDRDGPYVIAKTRKRSFESRYKYIHKKQFTPRAFEDSAACLSLSPVCTMFYLEDKLVFSRNQLSND